MGAQSSEASMINFIRSRAMKIINKEPARAPETCDSCQALPTSSERTINSLLVLRFWNENVKLMFVRQQSAKTTSDKK